MHNAIKLAIQRGWKVFPLIHRSRFATEQPLLSQATSSIEQIEKWQKQNPDCLWAVATGEDSGVFAVEFSRDIGIQTMRSLCNGDFSAMDTLQIRTAKQVTMFFRWPNEGIPISRRELIAEGITVRHSGGFAELPAEADEPGDQCRYSNATSPVQDAPSWLLSLIRRTFSKHQPADLVPIPASTIRTRIVGLSFALRERDKLWVCDFYSMDDDGALVKTLPFRFSSTILTLAARSGVAMNAENKEWLNTRFRKGSGILLLTLTNQQYEKLLAA
jgi:hypothetical protein